MADELDDLFTPEELAEAKEWAADAYLIGVEVPRSKITDAQLDELFFRIGQAVDVWAENIDGRDWDPFVYGHGPLLGKAA